MYLSDNQANSTIAFTGHRPNKLPEHGGPIVQAQLQQYLGQLLPKLIRQGYSTFYHGGMAGWDILAAESVLKQKAHFPHIRCITVLPFQEAFFAAPHWTEDWARRGRDILLRSDECITLAERYHLGVYHSRDRFLVKQAELLVAWWNGSTGGTAYTLNYARQLGRTIINLAEVKS